MLIAGAIGPLGELEVFDAGEHGPLYAEQARVLEGRGVDLFMIETFFDLDELVAAVEAVRGRLVAPDRGAAHLRRRSRDGRRHRRGRGAAGGSPSSTSRRSGRTTAPARMPRCSRSTRCATPALPLAALPNIGLASIVGGRVVYPHSTPEYFGDFAAQAAALGARIVGGCCGTTPAQIEAIRAALDDERAPRAAVRGTRASPRSRLPIPAVGETRLARALREGEWVVSVELDPPKGGTNDAMIEVARTLRQSGAVGFVDVNDNPMARARMNALMASIAIQREAGIETIPHVTPRDTTVMGLEGVLLGAHADGVRNILAVTGDPPHVGDYPGSRGVYEIDSIGLVQLLAGPQPGRRLRRQGDRPADVVLHRRRGQPDRRRSRPRARAVRAQGRGGRAVRDDAGAVRPRRARALPRAPRGLLADPAPRRRLAAAVARDGAAAAQRGAGDLRARAGARLRCATPGPTRPRPGSRSRASCSRRCAAASRGST